MPYAEFIFETGRHSVGFYEDEAEVLAAAKAANDRAKNGLPQLANHNDSAPAERIARIELYNNHPGDYGSDQLLTTSVAKKQIEDLLGAMEENGKVEVDQLALQVRNLSSPHIAKEHPHDSQYKQKADKVLTSGWDD